jgi:general secretion pathway protein G
MQQLRRRRTEAGGWTLIELLVVLSIIMILATMAMLQYRQSVTAAKEAVLKSDLHLMNDAIDQYYADKGTYPSSLDTLMSEGYLRTVPEDPFERGRKDTWVTTPSEPDPNNPTAATGIYTVKTSNQGTALDGSKYADYVTLHCVVIVNDAPAIGTTRTVTVNVPVIP